MTLCSAKCLLQNVSFENSTFPVLGARSTFLKATQQYHLLRLGRNKYNISMFLKYNISNSKVDSTISELSRLLDNSTYNDTLLTTGNVEHQQRQWYRSIGFAAFVKISPVSFVHGFPRATRIKYGTVSETYTTIVPLLPLPAFLLARVHAFTTVLISRSLFSIPFTTGRRPVDELSGIHGYLRISTPESSTS